MLSHPLSNFEIQKYYQNEPRLNGLYLKNNLPKVKDGEYVINLDEYKSIRTHWIALHMNGDNATYFNSFGVEHIPKEILKIHRQQKNNNKYFQNISIQFNNVFRLLYWIY